MSIMEISWSVMFGMCSRWEQRFEWTKNSKVAHSGQNCGTRQQFQNASLHKSCLRWLMNHHINLTAPLQLPLTATLYQNDDVKQIGSPLLFSSAHTSKKLQFHGVISIWSDKSPVRIVYWCAQPKSNASHVQKASFVEHGWRVCCTVPPRVPANIWPGPFYWIARFTTPVVLRGYLYDMNSSVIERMPEYSATIFRSILAMI